MKSEPLLLLLLVHAFATVFMTGLIWVVQLVHYPLFARVGGEEFRVYEAEHVRRILTIVGPTMLVEAGTALWLLLRGAPSGVPGWMLVSGAILLAVIWISTATLQGPMHTALERGHDPALIARLVATNWIRTIAWTLRGVLALAMIWKAVRP